MNDRKGRSEIHAITVTVKLQQQGGGNEHPADITLTPFQRYRHRGSEKSNSMPGHSLVRLNQFEDPGPTPESLHCPPNPSHLCLGPTGWSLCESLK